MSMLGLIPGDLVDDDGLPGPGSAWAGEVASDPSEEGVEVVLHAFGSHRWGPALYMPRGDEEPSRGCSCLVVFDDERIPWVTVWWPA